MYLSNRDTLAPSLSPYISTLIKIVPSYLDREFKLCMCDDPTKEALSDRNWVRGSTLSIQEYLDYMKPLFSVLDSLLKLGNVCSCQEDFDHLVGAAFRHFNTHHIQSLALGPEKVKSETKVE
jgi:hypothetical protein